MAFFDDFNGSTLDPTKWTNQTGNNTVSGGMVNFNYPSGSVAGAATYYNYSIGILEFKVKYTHYGTDTTKVASGDWWGVYSTSSPYGTGIWLWDTGGGIYYLSNSDTPNVFHIYKFIYKGTQVDVYLDGALIVTIPQRSNMTYFAIGNIDEVNRPGSTWFDYASITCTPNWQCEPGYTGYEIDGCGNRRLNSACCNMPMCNFTVS